MLKKINLLSGKIYWAKKLSATKFRYLIKIGGTAPFLYISKSWIVEISGNNGDTSINVPPIDDLADEFYEANYPA